MTTPEQQLSESITLAERARLREIYRRRDLEIDPDTYAPWQPGEMLMLFERRRLAAELLVTKGRFPERGSRCLEIGFGKLGWLSDCIAWGLSERDLYGLELSEKRASVAKAALPASNLLIGDASRMPWGDRSFDLIILSTVLSSIASRSIRQEIACEVRRVLAPNGAVLLYDIAVRNPRNKDLQPLGRREISNLFPGLDVAARTLTPAAPVARFVSKRSWTLATILSAFPAIRTHRLSLLTLP